MGDLQPEEKPWAKSLRDLGMQPCGKVAAAAREIALSDRCHRRGLGYTLRDLAARGRQDWSLVR